jgi:hypothetical protein
MEAAQLAVRLAANAEIFRHLLANVSAEQSRWRPMTEKWSLLEVINHLGDEEREDFRRRLDLTLHHPGEPWPPIDPPRWAIERSYNTRGLAESLERFLDERAQSVEWLRKLEPGEPDAVYPHPIHGPIPASALIAAWLAHDLIHIRQMTRLHYEYLRDGVGSEALEYAGPW